MSNYRITPIKDDFYSVKKIDNLLSTLVCYIMPREKVKDFPECEDSEKPGIYFLFNTAQNKIYIGQSGASLKDRFDQHIKNKDWWTDAIVFTTKTDDITLTHVKILESRFIDIASDCGLELDNITGSKEPHAEKGYIKECKNLEEQIIEITKLLNLKLFINKNKLNQHFKDVLKQDEKKPISYEIYGKKYKYTFAYQVLIDQCERIIEILGHDNFVEGLDKSSKMIVFNPKTKHKPFVLSNGTILNINKGKKDLFSDIKALTKVFPEFEIKWDFK